MNNLSPLNESPQETSEKVARIFFGVTDDISRRRAIRHYLAWVLWFSILIPARFYSNFNEVGPLGWGTTIFFAAYCLLTAIGLYFQPRLQYHSPIPLRGDWLDRVGAFWLVGCAFGPFFGWLVTTGTFPITPNSWRWLYCLRVILAAAVPIVLALPLTRYVRGKSAWVALPLLVGVTLLPISSAMNVSRDLWEGPVRQQVEATGRSEFYLRHTQRSLGTDD